MNIDDEVQVDIAMSPENSKIVENSKGSLCNIGIWDKVGPQRFEMLRPELRLADGVIFSFDANNEVSFTNLKKWLAKAQDSTPDYVGRIIVANHMK